MFRVSSLATYQQIVSHKLRNENMKVSTDRVFKAWAIFWRWKGETKIIPVYKTVNGDFPWFRTKKEAQAFMRTQKPKTSRSKVEWVVSDITLVMSFNQ